MEDTLREMAKDKGVNLHLLGYYDNVPELMSIADIFVHLSLREGLPVALMEAMAAGLPVIAADIRGIRDLIDSEKGGILINPYNSSELASTVKAVYEDRQIWKEMGDHNLMLIQDFDRKKVEELLRDSVYGDI